MNKIILARNFAKKKLSFKYFLLLKKIYLACRALPYGYNLIRLAEIFKSDKWGKHGYARHYQTHFRKYKFKRFTLLEIGVGGYHFPDIGGNSLRMWKRYFLFATICALDIYDKSFCSDHRIKIFQGDQTNASVLNAIIDQVGHPHIIIDDGSHINTHVIKTFEILFPKLKSGGIYVIEDTETAYWPDYGGDSAENNNPFTTMNFFKKMTDCLNHQEFLTENYKPSYYDLNICSIQFYHNLIFIFKGPNNEPSSIDLNNPESILADKMYI